MIADLQTLLGYRARLQRALFSGTRRIRDQNGEEIEFRSVREMQAALASLETTIAAAQSRPASQIHFKTSKGL